MSRRACGCLPVHLGLELERELEQRPLGQRWPQGRPIPRVLELQLVLVQVLQEPPSRHR